MYRRRRDRRHAAQRPRRGALRDRHGGVELLGSERLDFTPLAALVEPAKADSLWQLLVLQGAVSEPAELLVYAAPTYYGMAVAVVGEA